MCAAGRCPDTWFEYAICLPPEFFEAVFSPYSTGSTSTMSRMDAGVITRSANTARAKSIDVIAG